MTRTTIPSTHLPERQPSRELNKASKTKQSRPTALPSSFALSRRVLREQAADHALRALGKDGHLQQLHLLDPLVGDQSCQLRVLLVLDALAPMAQKHDVDADFLAEMGLLSVVGAAELDALGTRMAPKTNKKLLLALVAAPPCTIAGAHLDAIVREAKQGLAQRSVTALTQQLAQQPGVLAAQLGAALQVQQVAVGQDRLAMAPFYVGVAATLGLLSHVGAPLIFLLRCYGRHDAGFVLHDVAAGLLAASDERGLQLQVGELALQQQPAMVVRLYTATDERTGAPGGTAGFGAGRSAEEALRALDVFGARRALLAAAATHPQYPAVAFCLDHETGQLSAKRPDPDLLDLADVAPDVVRNFARDRALGRAHGIGLTQLYAQGPVAGAMRQLFEDSIPLNIEHIFTDSFASVRAQVQATKARHCGVLMPPAEAVAREVRRG